MKTRLHLTGDAKTLDAFSRFLGALETLHPEPISPPKAICGEDNVIYVEVGYRLLRNFLSLVASCCHNYCGLQGKPFTLQRQSDVEDMQRLLETKYADLAGVLAAKKAAGHRNLARTIAVIKDDDEDPAA